MMAVMVRPGVRNEAGYLYTSVYADVALTVQRAADLVKRAAKRAVVEAERCSLSAAVAGVTDGMVWVAISDPSDGEGSRGQWPFLATIVSGKGALLRGCFLGCTFCACFDKAPALK